MGTGCFRCGRVNPEGTRYCSACGFRLEGEPPNPGYFRPPTVQPQIKNYLVESILTMLFCCMPLGVVALVHAVRVDGEVTRGDYDAAIRSAESAKKFATWSAAAYLIFLIVVVLAALLLPVFSRTEVIMDRPPTPSFKDARYPQGIPATGAKLTQWPNKHARDAGKS